MHKSVNNVSKAELGEGNGTPLQYSCLENPMDGGAWWAAVHWVAKSWTRLSDLTFTFHFHALEKEMATHSSVLAWRIPWMEKPVGLQSMGSHRVGHDWSDLVVVVVVVVYNLIANTSKGVLFSAPFWCLCQKLSLSPLYFNKTLLHKSSERSSLVSGPGLNSSPLGAKNPGVFAWFYNNLSGLLPKC